MHAQATAEVLGAVFASQLPAGGAWNGAGRQGSSGPATDNAVVVAKPLRESRRAPAAGR